METTKMPMNSILDKKQCNWTMECYTLVKNKQTYSRMDESQKHNKKHKKGSYYIILFISSKLFKACV